MPKTVKNPEPSTREGFKSISVSKRDGSLVPLDPNKIRRVARWATKGIKGVTATALESGMRVRLTSEDVSTRQIQSSLIEFARSSCCDIESSGWRLVAGRLKIWGLWKEAIAARGYRYEDFLETVNSLTKEGYWTEALLQYSAEELQEAGAWIDPAFDLNFDLAGATLMEKRYLIGVQVRSDGGNYFRPKDLPQEAFLATALVLALAEKPGARMKIAREFYEAIASFRISLPTPMLSNGRKKNGNTTSCFIVQCPDSLEGIMDTATDLAFISKAGGGVGIDMSRVRASGSWIQGNPDQGNGVVPWIRIFNDVACAVDQGGKRAGACTIALPAWHRDVLDFLNLNTEAGDKRRKAYDIFPQLLCSDLFMERVRDQKDWTLFDPYEAKEVHGLDLAEMYGDEFRAAYQKLEGLASDGEIRVFKVVSAREIFVRVIESQIQSGLPYVVFRDTINRANTNPHQGLIPGVNLCTESFSVVSKDKSHSCNLASVNFHRLRSLEDLKSTCRTIVRLVDNAVSIGFAPISSAQAHNDSFRSIGIGALGWADWLARRQIRYSSAKAIEEADRVFEEFSYQCTQASADLAVERGPYACFEGSQWSKGYLLGNKSVEDIQAIATQPERWRNLSEQIQKTGIRNGWVTAIAPNTSSSLVQGCTASVLPPRSLLFQQSWSKGIVPVSPPEAYENQWHYSVGLNVHPHAVIEMVSTIQRWIDTGISMELLWNFNNNAYGSNPVTAVDMFRSILRAWESGCKATYYIRIVQQSYDDKECESCAS